MSASSQNCLKDTHLQSKIWMFGSSLALHTSIAAASLSAHAPVKGGLVGVFCVAVVSVVVVSVRVVQYAQLAPTTELRLLPKHSVTV